MSDTSGPACSRCGIPAIRKCGNQWLCAQHYRFGQMRARAAYRGLSVPSHTCLHALLPVGMICQDCGVPMVWLSSEDRCRVITLQHYRDGSFGLVCKSCNSRHAKMLGDSYRDMPKDHKLCPQCSTIKPLLEFYRDNGRSGKMKYTSHCKLCVDLRTRQWKANNSEKANATRRAYYHQRIADGNPIPRAG